MDWSGVPLAEKALRLSRRVSSQARESASRMHSALTSRRSPGAGVLKVAAGSTVEFPVISHTFVYQELMAMHDMAGADVRIFHSRRGDPEGLHGAFGHLDRHRIRYVSHADVNRADLQHFRRRVPERVESLLQALSDASGLSRDALLRDYDVLTAFTHARRVELWGADYVHTYFFYHQALNGLVTSWLLDIPRGASAYADHMLRDWPLKVVPLHLRSADVVVATSRRIRDELIAIGGPEMAAKILVKPNGVDGRRLPAHVRGPVAGRPLEAICICRIEPKKGLLALADAARALADRGRAMRVHVVGGADPGDATSEAYATDFVARIRDLDVGESFVLHGRKKQEELLPLLQQADVFVAPFVELSSGDKDGIPTAILEAMSTALPVVGTDAGSIPEVLDEGVEGFLVPQRAPQALAAALERFLLTPELAARMGAAARARFEREFDVGVTEPRLHARIRKAVERRRVGGVRP